MTHTIENIELVGPFRKSFDDLLVSVVDQDDQVETICGVTNILQLR